MKWDRTKGRPEPIRALNRIAEHENGEPLVPLAEYAPSLLIYRDSVIPYLRKTVAIMLQGAATALPEGVQLGVIDAYRPFARQQRIWDRMAEFLEEAKPGLSLAQRRRTLCRWVAPTDQKAPPGHCTGGAVDVFLLNSEGEEMDVVSPFGRFVAAPTYTLGLDPSAQANRTLLVEAMLAQGFSNCRDEWWHYSFGDAGWAVRTGAAECCYGKAILSPELYDEQERLWAEGSRLRSNPFLEGVSAAPPQHNLPED